jgi:hypothetical protein
VELSASYEEVLIRPISSRLHLINSQGGWHAPLAKALFIYSQYLTYRHEFNSVMKMLKSKILLKMISIKLLESQKKLMKKESLKSLKIQSMRKIYFY